MLFMASRMTNLSRFLIDFAQIHHRNHYLWQIKAYEMYFLNNLIWKSKSLFDPWAAEGMLCKQEWK